LIFIYFVSDLTSLAACVSLVFSFLFVILCFFFFFFSSRRRHTRSLRDWSSDVCSSDLKDADRDEDDRRGRRRQHHRLAPELFRRSEERRVGKECRSRWSRYHEKKKKKEKRKTGTKKTTQPRKEPTHKHQTTTLCATRTA